MGDTLYTPDHDRVATTNVWAFLHWLRATRGIELIGWAELQRFSAVQPDSFGAALAEFAELPDGPCSLVRHAGARDALIVRRVGVGDLVLSRDALLSAGSDLPAPIATLLARRWPKALLLRALAGVLLHADLRPDDRVLIAGEAVWPWLAMLTQGTTIVLALSAGLLAAAADCAATVLVAPAAAVAEAAFPRHADRPDLQALRAIIVTGGSLAPPARIRVYTWIKSDVMLLARSGRTVWGNPLEPVLTVPKPGPALFVAPSSPSRRA